MKRFLITQDILDVDREYRIHFITVAPDEETAANENQPEHDGGVDVDNYEICTSLVSVREVSDEDYKVLSKLGIF